VRAGRGTQYREVCAYLQSITGPSDKCRLAALGYLGESCIAEVLGVGKGVTLT